MATRELSKRVEKTVAWCNAKAIAIQRWCLQWYRHTKRPSKIAASTIAALVAFASVPGSPIALGLITAICGGKSAFFAYKNTRQFLRVLNRLNALKKRKA